MSVPTIYLEEGCKDNSQLTIECKSEFENNDFHASLHDGWHGLALLGVTMLGLPRTMELSIP